MGKTYEATWQTDRNCVAVVTLLWWDSGATLTLNLACRSCWDLVDLSSRQSQLVALKLEGDGFTALTRGHGSPCQGGKLGYAHYLSGLGRKNRKTTIGNKITFSLLCVIFQRPRCTLTRQPSLHIRTEQNPLGHDVAGVWSWDAGCAGSSGRPYSQHRLWSVGSHCSLSGELHGRARRGHGSD